MPCVAQGILGKYEHNACVSCARGRNGSQSFAEDKREILQLLMSDATAFCEEVILSSSVVFSSLQWFLVWCPHRHWGEQVFQLVWIIWNSVTANRSSWKRSKRCSWTGTPALSDVKTSLVYGWLKPGETEPNRGAIYKYTPLYAVLVYHIKY